MKLTCSNCEVSNYHGYGVAWVNVVPTVDVGACCHSQTPWPHQGADPCENLCSVTVVGLWEEIKTKGNPLFSTVVKCASDLPDLSWTLGCNCSLGPRRVERWQTLWLHDSNSEAQSSRSTDEILPALKKGTQLYNLWGMPKKSLNTFDQAMITG